MRPSIRPIIPLLFALAWLAPAVSGCSHVVKNDRHEVSSKARHGTDRFVVVDGHNIHYVEAGEGPPVLLIPGAFSTYRVWNRIIPDLSPHYRVLALDYLGMGDSDKPGSGFDYTVSEQADLVAKMIEVLELPGVHVVGASYGSAIALDLASRHPALVRSVACIEGGALIVPETLNYSRMYFIFGWPLLGDVALGVMKTGLFDETAARIVMGRAWEGMGPEDRKEVIEVVSYNIRSASRASWHGIYRAISGLTDLTGRTKGSRVPILYMYGGESKYRAVTAANADFLREHVRGSEIVGLADGIHDLQLQHPAKVAAIVRGFIEEGPAAKESSGLAITADADPAPNAGIDRLH